MFKQRQVNCAVNKTVWDKDKNQFNCPNSINVYHCIQDERNRTGEICIQPVWVQKDYCPEYNTGANALDTVPCNASNGCPDVTFLSNQVYRYPVCLNKTYIEEVSTKGGHSLGWLWIGIPVPVVILLSAIFFFIWRKKKHHPKEDEESELFAPKIEVKGTFYKTAAFHEAETFIKNGGRYLFLTGQWGSGKTTVAKEVYTSITGTPPVIVKNILQFDVNKYHQPVIFDEAVAGQVSDFEKQFLKDKIKSWCTKMITFTENPFIIFTLTEERFIDLFSLDEERQCINLSDSLTKGDRTQILHVHFQHFCQNQDFSEAENIAVENKEEKNESLGYPEICALFCRSEALRKITGPRVFCNRPLRHLQLHLQNLLHSNDRGKILILVFMSLNEMEIDSTASNKELFEILESHEPCTHPTKEEEIFENNRKMSIEAKDRDNTLKTKSPEASASYLPRVDRGKEFIRSLIPLEFVDKVPESPNKYRLQHDVIKRMTLIVYGTCHFDKLLEYAKPEDLAGWIEKSTLFDYDTGVEIKPVLKINQKNWKKYELKVGRTALIDKC